MSAPLFWSDGSSLAGWTLNGNVFIDSSITTGNPAPSIKVSAGAYCMLAVDGFDYGYMFEFDVFLPNSGTVLCNVLAGTNASGVGGVFLRMDARQSFYTYLAAATGVAPAKLPSSGYNATIPAGMFPSGRYAHVRIEFKGGNARVLLDGQVIINWVPVQLSGNYIFLHGDSSITSGAWFDNVVVGKPSKIAGVATLSSGVPAQKVRVRDWITVIQVVELVPDSAGRFSADIPASTYEVTAIGPAGYQPMTHGPVESVEYNL